MAGHSIQAMVYGRGMQEKKNAKNVYSWWGKTRKHLD